MFGEIVTTVSMSWCFALSSYWGLVLCFKIIIVILYGFFLAAIIVQCMQCFVVRWSIRCAYSDPFHFKDIVLPYGQRYVRFVLVKRWDVACRVW